MKLITIIYTGTGNCRKWTRLGNLGVVLISLNEDFQRMRFQKIQAILNLKEIVTNAGVGYLKVEDSIMISLKATRS